MLDVLTDTVKDLLNMLPFLFLAYLMLEYLEHRGGGKLARALSRSGPAGAAGGALLGCVPQCGFSVAAANLYSGRAISVGTLLAVFISTSDEALPILVSSPGSLPVILRLLLIKVLLAILAGFLVDSVVRVFRKTPRAPHDENHIHEDCGSISTTGDIVRAAVRHTLYIGLFIACVMLFLNLAIHLIGEDQLSALLQSDNPFQPFLSALIGLVPNCAPSVILTELYLSGSIRLSSLIAGLSTGAGMGLVVLFRSNHNLKENLSIAACLYLTGAVAGTFFHLFGL